MEPGAVDRHTVWATFLRQETEHHSSEKPFSVGLMLVAHIEGAIMFSAVMFLAVMFLQWEGSFQGAGKFFQLETRLHTAARFAQRLCTVRRCLPGL